MLATSLFDHRHMTTDIVCIVCRVDQGSRHCYIDRKHHCDNSEMYRANTTEQSTYNRTKTW